MKLGRNGTERGPDSAIRQESTQAPASLPSCQRTCAFSRKRKFMRQGKGEKALHIALQIALLKKLGSAGRGCS